MPKLEMPKGFGRPVGTPTEVYTRVARGALLCWFGGNGPLKGKYIYHADATPPSRGGKAEIGIHMLDTTGPTPRGNRVYQISILPEGEDGAVMSVENWKLPDPLARKMQADAARWAATTDDVACFDEPTDEGWKAGPAAATQPAAAPEKKAVKKPKAQKAM